ncbi:MAG: hypothetical protein ABR910_03775 [Acidobacteriaceae bacterium]|jgi:hypothetical protein
MRRVLAITLLIACVSPLVQPILAATADPDAQLPACCRRHGKHHCSMRMADMMRMMSASNAAPAFEAPPCPLYPAPATPPTFATATLRTSLPLSAQLLRTPAPLVPIETRPAQTFTASANLKRGPPALLA